MVTDRIQSKQILHSLIIDAIEMKAELKIIIFNSRVLASTETTGFCVLMKTLTSSDRKGGWPLVLTEIFQKLNLKVFLILKSFRSRDLACTHEKKTGGRRRLYCFRVFVSDRVIMTVEEKLERPRRFKLGVWGYTPPENLQFYVISMESLPLKCRLSSRWNVPSD